MHVMGILDLGVADSLLKIVVVLYFTGGVLKW
jgi:hypothetical protein